MTEAVYNQVPSPDRWSRFKIIAESFGVSAVVSIVVSTLFLTYFESRLENSKNHAAIVTHQKEQFDEAQNKVMIELGLYTGRVFNDNDARKRDLLDSAIITAQLETNNLSSEVGQDGQKALSDYSNELEILRKQVQAVEGPKDLGPVLISAQEVLKLHDEVGKKISENLGVSIF
jgi:hypothetical protein